MFTIRKEHLEAFRRASMEGFEDRMVAHLKEFLPESCAEMAESEIRRRIQYGIRRASAYSITAEDDVCRYIDLTFAFHPQFDTDPGLPWASETLRDPALRDPSDKMNALWEEALEHLGQNGASDSDSGEEES